MSISATFYRPLSENADVRPLSVLTLSVRSGLSYYNYLNYGRILFGDSIESLKALDGMIDLFINDSDHSAAYEAEEYRTIANNLSQHAVVLGDNSHCTDKLLEFSLQTI